ncbi:hypothetical protein BDV98DRAFT_574139 [Pterulicium gracile]|uniref:Uncharacterized protein n=1 Tax=Pterulicium gracile TaxID=1884261 RepID=A0A5C3QBG4_9AGAR|nr:hypothetical protein BDV98DRAFT_574139 [Pterula gracilis]
MSGHLLLTRRRTQRTRNVVTVTNAEMNLLHRHTLGPDSESLKDLAHRLVNYRCKWDRACVELQRQPERAAELEEEYACLAPHQGQEHVLLGEKGNSASYPEGVTKWVNNPTLLFETLRIQDEELYGQDPTTIEGWFWHSTMAFGSYTRLRACIMSTFSRTNVRVRKAFTKYYTTISNSRPSTPPNTHNPATTAAAALLTPPPEPASGSRAWNNISIEGYAPPAYTQHAWLPSSNYDTLCQFSCWYPSTFMRDIILPSIAQYCTLDHSLAVRRWAHSRDARVCTPFPS